MLSECRITICISVVQKCVASQTSSVETIDQSYRWTMVSKGEECDIAIGSHQVSSQSCHFWGNAAKGRYCGLMAIVRLA